ncbi:hypothetical protein PR048_005767 [Dryococelus australis]|uniref:HTH psq-type domain-containing protein n=1 Tax=Dryococelus australis TaxID=614101 RepID=A0ABQ9I9N7_9NEOP|nr:hypothetical protein PR048_005767 [Dryococelus australis]
MEVGPRAFTRTMNGCRLSDVGTDLGFTKGGATRFDDGPDRWECQPLFRGEAMFLKAGGRLWMIACSRQYKIPRRTLRDWLKREDRTPKHKLTRNADIVEEFKIRICNDKGIPHPFSNNTVEKDSFYGFMRINNDIVLRKVENPSYCRLMRFNKAIVSAHFELLRKTPDKMNLHNQPHVIYNVDGSGLQLTYNCSQLVLAEKGCKCLHAVTHGEKCETVTVVTCTNATGTNWIPHMILYKGKYSKNNSAMTFRMAVFLL